MKLSNFFPDKSIERCSEFSRLGYVDAEYSGVLAYADNLKYLHIAENNPNVSCLIVTKKILSAATKTPGIIISESPRDCFYTLHMQFINESYYSLPFSADVGSGCKIHPSAIIADGCRIGDDVTIGEQVLIREPVWIGSGVNIEPGVKIGVDGILYNKSLEGVKLIPHAGYVRIHDNVSLMTNSVIVRSIHDTDVTEIGAGSLIGLSSVIGHEAKIGEHVVISNQCVIARRSVIGDRAFLGTNVIIKEHVNIGSDASVMAGSVVISDVNDHASVSGNFASEHQSRMMAHVRNRRSNK